MGLNKEQQAIKAAWEALPEGFRFDLEEALAQKETRKQDNVPAKGRSTANTEKRAAAVREVQAVIRHLDRKAEIVEVECWGCGRRFASDWLYVRCCSEECLVKSTFERTGLTVDLSKTPEDRWGYGSEPPAIIRPETLSKLKEWAKRILELPTLDDFRGVEPENKVPVVGTTMQANVLEAEREQKINQLDRAFAEIKAELDEDLKRSAPVENKYSRF